MVVLASLVYFGMIVFLDKFEKNGDNHPEMRAVTERIIAVSVKAEDDIEEELLTASFCPTKLEQTLQRVVDEVEELVQITMNTTDLSNTNLTVGGSSSQHPSRVDEEDAMVGMGDNEMTTFNWNLQTLIISGEDDKDAQELLPHGIWNNLQQLRHLEINHKLQIIITMKKKILVNKLVDGDEKRAKYVSP
nr:putative late blight resistance protein homolog R1B-17 [Ipomoea batatas]